MKSYKGRMVQPGQLVDVYRNLHTGGFSIRDAKRKIVLVHVDSVKLKACSYVVHEATRQKILQEKRKRVCAYVQGIFLEGNIELEDNYERVYFDPYKTSKFKLKDQIILRSDFVICYETSAFSKGHYLQ